MSTLFQKFGVTGIAVLDFETTGLDPKNDYPTEVAIKKMGVSSLTGQLYVKNYSSMIRLPDGVEVPEFITKITGLTTEKVNTEGFLIEEILPAVQDLIDGDTLVIAHNANFDLGFLAHHFGIEPDHFMCTRSISILTEPDKNASLKSVYERMYGAKEQAHRAFEDVEMTLEVFNQFVTEHGNEAMMYFKNRLVNMPDRELSYTPWNAKVMDFAQKYVSSKTYEKLHERLSEAVGLLGSANSLLDNVHCYDTEESNNIDRFLREVY